MHLNGSLGSRLRTWLHRGRGLVLTTLILAALAWTSLLYAQAAAPSAVAAPVVITNCTNDSELRTALSNPGSVEITFSCGAGSHVIPIGAFMEVAGDATVNGANAITLDGGGTAALLQIFASAGLVLRDITLANATDNGANPIQNFGTLTLNRVEVRDMVTNDGSGGAVHNTGRLTVRNSRFIGNIADPNGATSTDGAAIFNDSGVVTITTSSFENNQATGSLSQGGAIVNINGGQMRVGVASVFRHNEALDGGAIYVGTGSVITIGNTIFISNTAGYGGAIESHGQTAINYAVFRDNLASIGDGGAIWVLEGDTDITYTTIANNQSTTTGGGISCYGNALSVINSTISDNRAGLSGSTQHGGGIYSGCSILNLTNSTLSGNQAPAGGGGGVYATGNGNTATIAAVTLADNNALFGGGVYNEGSSSTSQMTLQQTLLGNNKNGSANGNCDGVITSLGYNLASDTNCSALTQTGDQQGLATLKLGALLNYGGPTRTRPPLRGNPAIDAIPPAQCGGFVIDQRGVERPQRTNCDVGAVEDEAEKTVFTPVVFD